MATSETDLKLYWKKMSGYLRGELNALINEHLKDPTILQNYQKVWAHTTGEAESEARVETLIAAHGYWLLWYDDARNEFCFPKELVDPKEPIVFGEEKDENGNKFYEWDSSAKERYIKTAFKRGYNLESGAGSAGLGVRLNSGVCLRDTIRDTRGSVAFEDLLSSNFSFIGIPICREEENKQLGTMTGSGKPFVFFCLLFPRRGAWHDDVSSCCRDGKKQTCFYENIVNFCMDKVKPVAEIAYELLELRAHQAKVENLSDLEEYVITGNFRGAVLSKFVTPIYEDYDKKRDLLGFRTAVLFEANKGNDNIDTAMKIEKLIDLRKQHFESSYYTLESDQIIKETVSRIYSINPKLTCNTYSMKLGVDAQLKTKLCLDVELAIDIKYFEENEKKLDLGFFDEYYKKLLDTAHPWPSSPINGSFIDEAIEDIKWVELVQEKICQAIADFMVGDPDYFNNINLLLQKALKNKYSPINWPPNLKNVFTLVLITTTEKWRVILNGGSERFAYEMEKMPHTRHTIFRLMTALEASGKLPEKSKDMIVLTTKQNLYRLKSEAYSPDNTDEPNIIDCGARTALSHTKLLGTWEESEACNAGNDNTTINIRNEGSNQYLITIGDHSFLVEKSGTIKKGLGFATSKNLTGLKGGENPENLSVTEQTRSFFESICNFFTKHKEEIKKDCPPCLSQIAGKWYATWSKHTCSYTFIDNLLGEVCIRRELEAIHGEALSVGVNSFIISPLWIDGRLYGFLVLGSPQREYDTAKRIRYSKQQLNAVRTICDYLKLAISLEIKSDQALLDKANADRVKHLAGIEPEIRKLIDDVNQMKRAAERVANKIAPAQHGVFSYDSETVKLFRPKGEFTVELDVTGADEIDKLNKWQEIFKNYDLKRPPECAGRIKKLLEDSSNIIDGTEWAPSLSLRIQEGSRVASSAQWPFRSVHNPKEIQYIKWNDSYRPMLYALGLSRGNNLMKAFGKYFPNALEATEEKTRSVAARNLFDAAKQIFHRLHFPGDDLNCVYHNQLLAALYVGKRQKIKNKSIDITIDSYSDLIEYMATANENSELKWKLKGSVTVFVPALHQFCSELSDPGRVSLLETRVEWDDIKCAVNMVATNYNMFNPSKLHRNETSVVKTDTDSEHGVTKAVISLENCLQSYLSDNRHGIFHFKKTKHTDGMISDNKCIVFSIRLNKK